MLGWTKDVLKAPVFPSDAPFRLICKTWGYCSGPRNPLQPGVSDIAFKREKAAKK